MIIPVKIDADFSFLLTEDKVFCLKSIFDVVPVEEIMKSSMGMINLNNKV